MEKLTGIAFKITNDLINEANSSIDEDDLATAKTQIGEFVREL